MKFIGKDMDSAPRLKDVQLAVNKWGEVYLQVVQILRELYQECKLIHADLSEYNLLYYQNIIWIIDVSQSIEHDHPMAFSFLKRDIYNINLFFSKKQVQVFTSLQLFHYTTDIAQIDPKVQLNLMMEQRTDETEA